MVRKACGEHPDEISDRGAYQRTIAFARQRLGFGWGRSAATAGGVQDEVSKFLWMSDQKQVTGAHLDRRRMHTVCKETLQLRRRGSIVLRYGVPRRLEVPRCFGRP